MKVSSKSWHWKLYSKYKNSAPKGACSYIFAVAYFLAAILISVLAITTMLLGWMPYVLFDVESELAYNLFGISFAELLFMTLAIMFFHSEIIAYLNLKSIGWLVKLMGKIKSFCPKFELE